jgi:hypothetical protein
MQMKSEKVEITWGTLCKVTATFELINPTPKARTVKIGFPVIKPSLRENADSVNRVYGFTLNGAKLTETTVLGPAQDSPAESWYGWTCMMKPGSNSINLTYSVKPDNSYYSKWQKNLHYVLYTGKFWNGTIKNAEVIISFPANIPKEQILDETSPSGYEIQGNKIRWAFKDFKPTIKSNIQLKIIDSTIYPVLKKYYSMLHDTGVDDKTKIETAMFYVNLVASNPTNFGVPTSFDSGYYYSTLLPNLMHSEKTVFISNYTKIKHGNVSCSNYSNFYNDTNVQHPIKHALERIGYYNTKAPEFLQFAKNALSLFRVVVTRAPHNAEAWKAYIDNNYLLDPEGWNPCKGGYNRNGPIEEGQRDLVKEAFSYCGKDTTIKMWNNVAFPENADLPDTIGHINTIPQTDTEEVGIWIRNSRTDEIADSLSRKEFAVINRKYTVTDDNYLAIDNRHVVDSTKKEIAAILDRCNYYRYKLCCYLQQYSVTGHQPVISRVSGTIGDKDPTINRNRIILHYTLADADFPDDTITIRVENNVINRTARRKFKGGNSIINRTAPENFIDTITGCIDQNEVYIIATDKYHNTFRIKSQLHRLSKPSFVPEWGYASNSGALPPYYKNMRVYIDMDSTDINRWPHNQTAGMLKREEIVSAINLGLNCWASVLDSMDWKFVSNPDSADFKIIFKTLYDGIGGYTEHSDLRFEPNRLSFRQNDLASPKLLYERFSAYYNVDSANWCLWTNIPSIHEGSIFNKIDGFTWHAAKDSLKKYSNPASPDSNWLKHKDAVAVIDNGLAQGKNFPHDDIFGKGLGFTDISVLVKSMFGLVLVGGWDGSECMSYSSKPKEIAKIGNDTVFIRKDKFVVRARLRKHHIDSISDTLSPGSFFGNSWDYCWGGGRGVFDLDADRLAAGSASGCDCSGDTTGGKYSSSKKPYTISYPKVRSGYTIIMHNKNGGSFTTDNWHVAQDSMGWVHSSEAREAKWYLYDIIKP